MTSLAIVSTATVQREMLKRVGVQRVFNALFLPQDDVELMFKGRLPSHRDAVVHREKDNENAACGRA